MSSEGCVGLVLGYYWITVEQQGAEAARGKNGYQRSLCQVGQASLVTSVARPLLPLVPAPMRTFATLLPVASLLICPTAAMIKQGDHAQVVKCLRAPIEEKYPQIKDILSHFSKKNVNLFSFITDHSSFIFRGAFVASTIALPFIGMGPMAAGIGLPLVYRAMESALPAKIRLMMEKYMYSIVTTSVMIGGDPFSQFMSGVTLLSDVPGVSGFCLKKVENVVRRVNPGGASLEEIDAPWREQNNLSYDIITFILDTAHNSLYEINPSHCSKQAYIDANLTENREFERFLTLFNEIDWKDRYKTLKPIFRDDDRFIDFLKEKYCIESAESIREDFETYVIRCASEEDRSKEDYLASKLRMQMKTFVSILSPEKITEGEKDVEECRNASGKILDYLLRLPKDNHNARIEAEDILIKLAIEADEQCPRSLKRATAEILLGITTSSGDPVKDYELKIRQRLQQSRQKIMQNTFLKYAESMTHAFKMGGGLWMLKDRQTTDVHAVAIAQNADRMDLFRQYLCLGFYPLSEHERSQFGLAQFMVWSTCSGIRDEMFKKYWSSLDDSIKEDGEIYFSEYIRKKIGEMKHLAPKQQAALVERFTDEKRGEKNIKDFHRLFFVMQGILNLKPMLNLKLEYDDWTEVALEPIDIEQELSEWVMTEET